MHAEAENVEYLGTVESYRDTAILIDHDYSDDRSGDGRVVKFAYPFYRFGSRHDSPH